MSDSITITKKAFENWFKNIQDYTPGNCWDSITTEAKKINWYVVVSKDNLFVTYYLTEKEAKESIRMTPDLRVVHLREVET